MAIIGANTIGPNFFPASQFALDMQLIHCKFTAIEYGILTSISFYTSAVIGTVDMSGAIWTNGGSSGTPVIEFLAQDTGSALGVSTTPQWVTVTMPNVLLSAGTTYWLSMWGTAPYNYYEDAGAANQKYNGMIGTFRTYPQNDSSSTVGNNVVSIYGTYTPRAADASVYRTLKGIQTLSGVQSIRF